MPSAAPDLLTQALPEPFRFTREDYDAIIAAGILDENDQVELIDGEIVKKMPINPSHSSTVNRLVRLFSKLVSEECVVAPQNPIALGAFSEPEPDIALLKLRPDFYGDSHAVPAEVHLLVEVADSSLRFDRDRKIPLYAAAGIPEVWLIDLVGCCLIRYRQPVAGAFAEVTRHFGGESVPIPPEGRATIALKDLGL
jgi:Uma2 family endonuclease